MASTQKVAIVTGASTGIGKAAAVALVEAGFKVIGTSRNASRAERVSGVQFVDLDVASDSSVEKAIAEVVQAHGRIDVLVNNAGIGSSGAAEESSAVQAQHVFDINVFGVIRVTNAVLPIMRAQKSGRIVNMSSILGIIPQPYMAVYAASKHAVEGYSESLDHELREFGVRVTLVEPAWTNTSFEANSIRPDRPLPVYAERRQVFEEYMIGEIKDGDDPATVAKAILAAATDKNPKVRYAGSSRTASVSTMRRLVPVRMFDQQLRKLNRLPA
ncbi:oxidoreductase [Arthrobacter sp. Soil736]|uniref:oxidoreductase n=1 Tax=Arthrobacter sp. Soil736 TaxID=1736395 RepID=UPI0006F825D3|nr:oxidoreductase [Arthrobacter sp. Soil736]KRE67739.1 oxidoreductase [Arthrobacter sp. Soil736]